MDGLGWKVNPLSGRVGDVEVRAGIRSRRIEVGGCRAPLRGQKKFQEKLGKFQIYHQIMCIARRIDSAQF